MDAFRLAVYGLLVGPIAYIFPAAAFSGETENIFGCAEAAKNYGGVTLGVSDAKYEGKIVSNSKVFWDGVICEVKVGEVNSLTIDGVQVVADGWPVAANRDEFDSIAGMIDREIATLEKKQEKLRQLSGEVERQFRTQETDADELRNEVERWIGLIVSDGEI